MLPLTLLPPPTLPILTVHSPLAEHPAARSIASPTLRTYSRLFLWTSFFFWTPLHWLFHFLVRRRLTKFGGPFSVHADAARKLPDVDITAIPVPAATAGASVGGVGKGDVSEGSTVAEIEGAGVAEVPGHGAPFEMVKTVLPEAGTVIEVAA